MTASINPLIHNTIAESILQDLITKSSNYYYYLGKTLPYNVGVEVLETPTSDYKYELSTRKEIIELKEISASDVSFVVPRYDWVSGTVYDHYDDEIDISDSVFYVITDEYNVYKCLDNNYDSISTVKPIGIDSDPFITADGYKWKFMMNLPLSLRNKFLTTTHMPVTTAVKSKFYNNGGIDSIVIENGGTGYVEGSTDIIVSSTTGTGAVLTPVIVGGVITSVIIDQPGEGYTYAHITVTGNDILDEDAVITVVATEGNLETVQANVELLAINGTIDLIKITNQGSGYVQSNTTVTVDGDGFDLEATPVIVDGKVVSVTINPLKRGHSYTYATVTINGSGIGATARAIMSPQGGHGKNAISELYAETLLFFTNISTEKNNGFSVNNDFRQFGILKNPTKYGSQQRYNSRVGSTCFVVHGTVDISKFSEDDNLIDSNGNRFKIVSVESTKLLLQSYDNASPVTGASLMNTKNSEFAFITTVTNPDVDKYSGKMLYTDNRSPFFQTDDQTVTFQTVLKF